MRLRTDGDYAHRIDTIEAAMDALEENTKTAVVLAACEHARQDGNAKREALPHPDMTPELADLLSTPTMQLRYETTTYVDTD
jgi:hypothetical protein